MTRFNYLVVTALVLLSGVNRVCVNGGRYYSSCELKDDYYRSSCKDAESVIQKAVNIELDKDIRLGAGLIRMAYHDCFVEGCDASILLDGKGTEKTAPVNDQLNGFEVIDAAKAAVEQICPGVVSCADVVQYAARDSTVRLQGSTWKVQGGRKDGVVSRAETAEAQIPGEESVATELIKDFAQRGLSARQMVVLTGSHTVGVGHCDKIVARLYNFSPTHFTDPTIDPVYAEQLKAICPQYTWNTTIEITMDVFTPSDFDNKYYDGLEQHKGLFTSDQSLFEYSKTRPIVTSLASSEGLFGAEFGQAMRALGAVGVKSNGQIRYNCRRVNSA